jgi:hypothetical protein
MRALEAGILEPERQLALQNALMVAKVLRYEFPHDWYVSKDIANKVLHSC